MCLGVVERVYGGTNGRATTTRQVAQILEERYGIFSGFLEANTQWLEDETAKAFAGAALSAAVNGEAVTPPLERVADELANRLFAAISNGSIETMARGPGTVPTEAAKRGINHRKHPAKTGVPRPSFIDTGVLHNAIKGWAEE